MLAVDHNVLQMKSKIVDDYTQVPYNKALVGSTVVQSSEDFRPVGRSLIGFMKLMVVCVCRLKNVFVLHCFLILSWITQQKFCITENEY